MSQTVLITGTGRPYALGFNFVKRYLENGDCVFATIRPSGDFTDSFHIQHKTEFIQKKKIK